MTGRDLMTPFRYAAACLSFLLRRDRALNLPVSVCIEPTNRCNLRCPLCAIGSGTLTRPRGDMSLDTFRDILDHLPNSIRTLYLWGQGEPFLAPGFLDMVTYASQRGFRTVTSTNGHFLDDVEKILASGLNHLIVSLDGVDAASYEEYRRGGNFIRVTDGIRALGAAKKKQGRGPLIELQYLVTKSSASGRRAFTALARDLGVDRAIFKTLQVVSFGGEEHLPADTALTRYHRTEDGSLAPDTHYLLRNRCLRLYYSCQIDWQGTVLPCCFDKNSAHVLGVLPAESFTSIWNGERYRRFRILMNSRGRILPMCGDCSEGVKRMTVNAF